MAKKNGSDLFDILFDSRKPVSISGRNKSVYGVIEYGEKKVTLTRSDSSISSFEEKFYTKVSLKIKNVD